ncbi:ABC transporter substrate-binding protein [Clostridium sediminicola]|uniref:ABC transporter substrate-binding protein n=1 Tax=Clostridium sediminicola TaxID=3114879 RepID=UPI0031F259F5
MKRKSILIGLLSLVMLTVSACSSNSTETSTSGNSNDDVIKIGHIQPRSGPLGTLGEQGVIGVQIAADMVNKRGGINGKNVEIVVADVPDTAAAQNEVNRLINKENINIITGVYGSAFAEVASGICSRNDALYWETISVSDRITEAGLPGVFRATFNGATLGEAAAVYAAEVANKLNIPFEDFKVAILSENSDFGQSTAKGALEFCEENGIQVVEDIRYSKDVQDTAPMVLKIKDANPDAVIATSYINDGINFWKQSKQLDFNPKSMIGIGSGYGLISFSDALGTDAEGVIDIDPATTPNLENLDPEMAKAVEEFMTEFEKQTGNTPGATTILSWQAAWVLLNNVIAEASSTETKDLVEVAKNLDIPLGTLPTGAGVKFDENGQNERAVAAAMQWQSGELVVVYPETVAKTEPVMIPLPTWSER